MTDDEDTIPPPSSQGNGRPPAPIRSPKGGQVRSGLAHKRNPALVALGDFGSGARRVIFRDKIALFLGVASAGLLITFFSLLGVIGPNTHGSELPISRVLELAVHKQIATATLYDHDNRVEVTLKQPTSGVADTSGGTSATGTNTGATGTTTNTTATTTSATGTTSATTASTPPLEYWAAYPASGVQTQQLLQSLASAGTVVTVDQQPGKAQRAILVQFLIPIVLLVCLFALFMRFGADGGAGGIAGFSKFTGKGKRKGKGTLHQVTFSDVAGAGEAVAELREIRDYLADPSKYLAVGAAAPKGVLLVGPPGTGKTLLAKAVAGEADAAFFSLSGSDFVESLVGVGAARVRDLFAKARKTAPAIIFIDEFDAAGTQARRRHRSGQRRARADAQRAARRDGRFRRRRRPGRDGRHQPPGHPRSGAAAPGALRPPGHDRRARRARAPGDPAPAREQAADGPRRVAGGDRASDAGLQRRRACQRDQRGGAAERARFARADRSGDTRGGDRPRRRRPRQEAHPHRAGALADLDPRGLPCRRRRGARTGLGQPQGLDRRARAHARHRRAHADRPRPADPDRT